MSVFFVGDRVSVSQAGSGPVPDGIITSVDLPRDACKVLLDKPYCSPTKKDYWFAIDRLTRIGGASELEAYKNRVLEVALQAKKEQQWSCSKFEEAMRQLDIKTIPGDTYLHSTVLKLNNFTVWGIKIYNEWTYVSNIKTIEKLKWEKLYEEFESHIKGWYTKGLFTSQMF